MKPPAWRADAHRYPHTFTLQPRYSDEDRLGHVNNIAIAGYYDEARSRFSREVFAAVQAAEISRIVTADSRVTYLAEVFYAGPEPVVRTGILRIGKASYDLAQALFQGNACVGVCTTTFVQASAEGSSPLSEALKGALGRWLVEAPAE